MEKLEQKKDERITARVSASIREKLEYAASLQGATLNQFLVSSAIHEAEHVIERERVLHLNQKESEVYLRLLAEPPQPNERLMAAFRSYQDDSLHVER